MIDKTVVLDLQQKSDALQGMKEECRAEMAECVAGAGLGEMPKAFTSISLRGEFLDSQEAAIEEAMGQAVLAACSGARDAAVEAQRVLQNGVMKQSMATRDALLVEVRKGREYLSTRTPDEITRLAAQEGELAQLRAAVTIQSQTLESLKRDYSVARDAYNTYAELVRNGQNRRAATLFLADGRDESAFAKRREERAAMLASPFYRGRL